MEQVKKEKDTLTKRIERLYSNYGIDISEIDDDELERLKQAYRKNSKSLEQDIKNSEIHKDKFSEDDII